MRAFITGGSGFIGTNLVADLLGHGVEVLNYDRSPPLESGHEPYWVRGDILDTPHLAEAVAAYGPTHLVHLAARVDTDGRTQDPRVDATSFFHQLHFQNEACD